MSRQLPPDTPLLPRRAGEERPLFIIMTIMSFLAGLTLLLTLTGVSVSQKWQSDLDRNVTVQLLPQDGADKDALAAQAIDIIQSAAPDTKINRMSESDSLNLLRPWLGEQALPEDLPVPIILTIRGKNNAKIDGDAIEAAFIASEIDAVVDDHSHWGKDISRTWKAVKAGMMGIIVIVLTASAAIAAYATQSVLKAREAILRVLSHVGAPDRFITSLFARRFFALGLAAALTGTLGVLLFLIILFGVSASFASDVLPLLSIGLYEIVWLLGLVGVMGGISAGVAVLSSLRWLGRERRMR